MKYLLKLYSDPQVEIREATSWLCTKICKYNAKIITINDEITRDFIATLINSL